MYTISYNYHAIKLKPKIITIRSSYYIYNYTIGISIMPRTMFYNKILILINFIYLKKLIHFIHFNYR